jgi:hypothetical protein
MNMKSLVSISAALAVLAPLGALPASAADKMMAAASPALTCHTAAAGEHVSAVAKVGGADVMLACVPTEMMMADHMKMVGKVAAKTRAYGPNIDGLTTPSEVDSAWKRWNDAMFSMIPSSP